MSNPNRKEECEMRTVDLLLILGWLAGLVAQVVIAVTTGYSDLFPPQLMLALALCFGAGYRARQIDPSVAASRCALAGAQMMGILVVGYFIVALITLGPDTDSGGETWFSLLLEAPFWIGVPLVTSSVSGYLGGRVAGGPFRSSPRG